MCIYIYIYIVTCICVCMCVYIYTHTYISGSTLWSRGSVAAISAACEIHK